MLASSSRICLVQQTAFVTHLYTRQSLFCKLTKPPEDIRLETRRTLGDQNINFRTSGKRKHTPTVNIELIQLQVVIMPGNTNNNNNSTQNDNSKEKRRVYNAKSNCKQTSSWKTLFITKWNEIRRILSQEDKKNDET